MLSEDWHCSTALTSTKFFSSVLLDQWNHFVSFNVYTASIDFRRTRRISPANFGIDSKWNNQPQNHQQHSEIFPWCPHCRERSRKKGPMFDRCFWKSWPIGWFIFLTVQSKPTNWLHWSRYRQYLVGFEEANYARNHLCDRSYCGISVEVRLSKQSDDASWRLPENVELRWFQGVCRQNVSYVWKAEDSDANRDKWQHIRATEKFFPLLTKQKQRVCLDVTSAASAVIVRTVFLAFLLNAAQSDIERSATWEWQK